MRRNVSVVVGVLALSAALSAQGRQAAPPPPLEPGASQADVDKALLAAPANLRNQATVIKWNPADWSYTTLRKGTSQVVCFDKSGLPGQQPFSVECTQLPNMDRVKQNMKFESETDPMKRKAALDAAEKDGSRAKPQFGSVWYHLMGQDQATARPHTTIAVPGATAASLGLADNGREGRVWVMDSGTSTAHLMVPGE
jgi:hypothetical protein